jgi:AcrR family transcriptional regulator
VTSGRHSKPIAAAASASGAEPIGTQALQHPDLAAPGSVRERLLDATVRVAGRRGYAGASVSQIAELAGTPRATFYEHFSNREESFLAAQRGVAERALRCIGAEGSTRVRLPGVLEDVLVRAAENPASARLLLIEGAGASKAARSEHARFLATAEGTIDASLQSGQALQITGAALLDGITGTIAMRLLGGKTATLPGSAAGLLAWARSYRLGPGESRLAEREWTALGRAMAPAEPDQSREVTLLPRGRSALGLADTAEQRCDRIVEATAKVVARRGFAALTVADLVAAARVPRSAFYAQFDGKQAAFLAAQERVLREAMGAAAAEFVLGESWQERVWKGLRALLYHMGERPHLARLCVLEAEAAGEEAVLRSHATCMAFTLFVEEGYRQDPRGASLPAVCSGAIAFAIQGAIRRALLRKGADRLPELLPQCAHLALAPFIGASRALDFVTGMAEEVA